MKRAVLCVLGVLLIPLTAAALEIKSVYPETVFPGTPVTVIGGPFGPEVLVDLAGQQLRPQSVGSRQLIFIVPQLPVGEHALFLRDGQESSAGTFSLRIELPPPVISTISPANLDECSTDEQRQISLYGEHIQPGAQLLLDGAVVPFTSQDQLSFSFTPPPLRAGSYGLQLINPDGKRSLPHTLWFNNLPEIESVTQGDNFVNSYQVVVRGKNFFHNSVLLVSEYPAGFADLPPRQRFIPAQGGAAFRGDRARLPQSESVSYRDCQTLIYNRYPPSGQSMRLVIRVGNPDGKQTSPYEVFLP